MVREIAAKALAGLTALVLFSAPGLFAQAAGVAESAESTSLHIEQVQAKLPEVTVWLSGGEALSSGADVAAMLGAKPLTLLDLRPVAPEDTAHTFFLVDCSTSTTAGQMDAVKTALADYAGAMGQNERATLITFGVDVQVVLDETDDPAALRSAAQGLRADQPGTLFFDALAKAAELAGREAHALDRKLIYIFSDSADYNLGGYTKSEVEQLIASAGAPIYALGFETGPKEELDNFGALARSSGGGISIVNEGTLPGVMQTLMAGAQSAWVATFAAQDNRVEETPQTLRLTAGGQSAEARATLRFWTPDTVAPTLLSAAQQGDDSIVLTFSKPVQNANLRESYTVQSGAGGLLGVAAARYDEAARTATLTLEKPPAEARLTVACPGVVDCSMEENPVAATAEVNFAGPAASAGEAAPGGELSGGVPAAAWLVLTLAGVAAIAGVAVAAAKKRGGRALQSEPPPTGGTAAASALAEELPSPATPQVHFVQGTLPLVRLDVTGAGGAAKRVDIPINKTLFVGRGDVCDVVFDDPEMSRQHFVIEETGGAFTITNLSETGGTRLNGVALQNPRPLHSGDAIEAGRERIVFLLPQRGGPPA